MNESTPICPDDKAKRDAEMNRVAVNISLACEGEHKWIVCGALLALLKVTAELMPASNPVSMLNQCSEDLKKYADKLATEGKSLH